MRFLKKRMIGVLLALVMLTARHAAASAEPQIWFAPLDHHPRTFLHNQGGSSDFMALFQPGASWTTVAKHVQVFKLYTGFVELASDQELQAVIDGLRRLGIKLALETQFLTKQPNCGQNLEAYSADDRLPRTLQRLQNAGAQLDYIAMDEPLYFGHAIQRPDACRTPVAELAANAAKRLAVAKSYYPNVKVGDIEPIASFEATTLAGDLDAWMNAYKAATGEPLAFMHVDIDWHLAWKEKLRAAASVVRSHQIPFGIIYSPEGHNPSDAEQARGILQRIVAIEVDTGIQPDQAIFQSWVETPHHVLPESDPVSFTGIIATYLRGRSTLSVTRQGTKLVGQLTDANGKGIPHAQVELALLDRKGAGRFGSLHAEGTVPANARSAMLAIRVNQECHCAKDSDIALRDFRFTEAQEPKNPLQGLSLYGKSDWQYAGHAQVGFAATAEADKSQITIRAKPDETAQLNQATRFPVAAGSKFEFGLQLRASEASDDSGIVALIFLGADGREVSRQIIPIHAATQHVDTATTDADGRFTFVGSSLPDVSNSRARVNFEGGQSWFPSSAQIH